MKVLTIGTFDLFHYGHANLLNACSRLGDVIVGVNSDHFVEEYKGERPVLNTLERVNTLLALGYSTVVSSGKGYELITKIQPDILVVGSDWADKDYLSQIGMTDTQMRYSRIALVYVPYTDGISSTEIKARCKQ